jgi:lysophospholipase L1-like esterase
MPTQNIRNLVAQFVSQFETACDVLDNATPTPAPAPAPTLPPALDCLAGVIPPATNQYADEMVETAWINLRNIYRTTMKNAPSGSIVLIGDSMVERMTASQISPYAVNLGISGESIRQFIYRLNENDINNQSNLIHRAGAVVILTGVNDLSDPRNGTQANASATVNFVYNRIKTWLTGKVVICKLIPVDANVFSTPSNPLGIAPVNAWIDANFSNNPNVRIVDVNHILAPNGSLLPEHHNGDGQHLVTNTPNKGYAVLNDGIKAALTSLGI